MIRCLEERLYEDVLSIHCTDAVIKIPLLTKFLCNFLPLLLCLGTCRYEIYSTHTFTFIYPCYYIG